MLEDLVKAAAKKYLLKDTVYRPTEHKLRVPGLSPNNKSDGVDLSVYLGDWLVGAVECKKSWTATDSSGNGGWDLIYAAIGQLMFYGRAPTRLGQHPDINRDAESTLSRIWRREQFDFPDLPLAAVFGAHLDGSNKPRLDTSDYIENIVRARLSRLGVDLILCWQDGDRRYLDPMGRSVFLKHVDRYAAEVEKAMAKFEQNCEATISLLNRIIAGSYASIEGDDRAATLAIDIADACFILYSFDCEPKPNQEWDVGKLQALAKDCGGDQFLHEIISSAKQLIAHARRLEVDPLQT